jgi:hypothetical protein
VSTVAVGNAAPREWVVDDPATGEGHYEDVPLLDGQSYSVTVIPVPPEFSPAEVGQTLTLPGGIWERHSSAPPSWISSDDNALAVVLGAFVGLTPVPWLSARDLAEAVGLDLS